MIKAIRVVKVPESGFLVIGNLTVEEGSEVDIDSPNLKPDELRNLVKKDYVVFVGDTSPQEKG